MTISTGFIVSVEDEVDFYQIKRFIQSLPNVRLIYCTQNSEWHLYVKTEEELMKIGGFNGNNHK